MIPSLPLDSELSFSKHLSRSTNPFLRRGVETLQVNIGKLCNLACRHCHVEAGPTKLRENMNEKTLLRLLELIDLSPDIQCIDITGGAPELNPHFKTLVKHSRLKKIEVIDRCNLTVFFEKGQEQTPEFLAEQGVQVVASLPCYSRKNVDQQRGNGVFDKSIRALLKLNELGYGRENSGLKLHLVYNPLGPTLPPQQDLLREQYKKELKEDFGIVFNDLYAITNFPIKRFLVDLQRQGKLEEYMDLLVQSFNVRALDSVMCKSLVSISWDGKIFDCDFNQMLDLPLKAKLPRDLWSVNSFSDFNESAIQVANHCFACTAGSGSSCTGTLS